MAQKVEQQIVMEAEHILVEQSIQFEVDLLGRKHTRETHQRLMM